MFPTLLHEVLWAVTLFLGGLYGGIRVGFVLAARGWEMPPWGPMRRRE